MSFYSKVYLDLQELPGQVVSKWEGQIGLAFDQTFDWYSLLHEYVLRDDCSVRTIVVYSSKDASPVAILPLALTIDAALPFGVRCLRSLTNYYSSAFEPIILSPDVVATASHELIEYILTMNHETSFVEIEPVPKDSNFFAEMTKSFRKRGYLLSPYRRFSNWFHLTNGQSFDAYFSERDSKIRNTFRRKQKKLRQLGYKVEIVQRLADIDIAMEDYNLVYRKSWKGEESHVEFIAELCRKFASNGWLRLGILRLEGRPIAAQIWFVYDHVASIFKLSYDEEYKSLSAGSVLTMAMMKQALDVDKVEKVDYLTGDDAYKRNYMNSSREMWSFRAYKKTSIAGVFGMYEVVKDAIRDFRN